MRTFIAFIFLLTLCSLCGAKEIVILPQFEVGDTIIKLFAREQGIDVENSAEWKMDTKPLLISAVSMICKPKHLIEEQFGNIPYFTFNGIPLKAGKIPASMVLTDELQIMCYSLDELDMDVKQIVNTEVLNIGEDSGCYVIELNGNKGETSVEGKLLYSKGIMNYGYIDIKIKSETETLITNFTLDRLDR